MVKMPINIEISMFYIKIKRVQNDYFFLEKGYKMTTVF